MAKSTKTIKVEDTGASYRVGPSTALLDEGSEALRLRLCEKYGKNNRWFPRMTYTKKQFFSIADVMEKFLSDARNGVEAAMVVSGHRTPVCKMTLDEDGVFHLEEIECDLFQGDNEPKIISDPESDEAKALLGKKVLVSYTRGFKEFRLMVLEELNADDRNCFRGTDIEGHPIGGGHIKEYVENLMPLDFSSPDVRDSLRGEWVHEKSSSKEMMLTSFFNDNGVWKANNRDAVTLMNEWEFLDGSVIGEVSANI